MKTVERATKVKKEVIEKRPLFVTDDGKEFENKKEALFHEDLLKSYPKLSEGDIEWIEHYTSEKSDSDFQELKEAFDSNDALILIEHSGCEDPVYEKIDANLSSIKTAIQLLHRRSQGFNYNSYIRGIVYKKESLCFNDEKKLDDSGYYESGAGRNINEVFQ